MAVEELSTEDVIYRAHIRAIPSAKAIRLVQSRIRQSGIAVEQARYRLSAALIALSAQTSSSTLSTSYLAEALSSGTLDSQELAIQVLFGTSNGSSLPSHCLAAISATLMGTAWATAIAQPLPAQLANPSTLSPPDIGTSASATAADAPLTPTLQLLLPLLRLCADSVTPPPLPIVALTVRLLSSLEPYPAPPLEVGLEASALLPQLPDAIAIPLRTCLGGLMADVAISQSAAELSLAAPPAASGPAGSSAESQLDFPALPSPFPADRPTPPVLLSHMISFLLTYTLNSGKTAFSLSTPSAESGLWSADLPLLKAGRYFASPEKYLVNLLESSLQLVMGTHQTITPDLQRSLLFVTERLPQLLKYWKENPVVEWPYPTNLTECLTTAFELSAANLSSFNAWVSATYAARLADAEGGDDGGSFSMVEGWSVTTIQAVLVRRLVDLDLLESSAVGTLLPGGLLPSGAVGESLLDRACSASHASLMVLEIIVAASPGASRAFAAEFSQALVVAPQIPLPDNLLINLSAHPTLLIALSSAHQPKQLLAFAVNQLLHAPTDESAQADDPQGVLTRFGEGVVFVEAVVDTFDLELPWLLARSRRAVSLGHMDGGQKTSLNGWVKALFSTEGIDDHILLSTPPRDLCWLAPSIIQQAIAATAAGRLDRDALHGGLSYFSQPLLSWCLGGIISWLSSEVIRNGLISALHLDVLQTILLSDSTPEVLIRINGKAIARILDPQSALATVFQAASFDAQAVRTKLESIHSAGRSWNAASNPSLPLNTFRSQLHVIRHLAMTQQPWSGPFLADFQDCLVSEGPLPMLEVLYSELVRPSLEFDRANGDPLACFAPTLLALTVDGYRPLAEELITTFVPRYIESSSAAAASTSDAYQLSGLIKASLLVLAELEPSRDDSGPIASLAARLAEGLAEDLGALGRRPVMEASGTGIKRVRKRKLAEGSGKALEAGQKALLEGMRKALSSDEELCARFPALAKIGLS